MARDRQGSIAADDAVDLADDSVGIDQSRSPASVAAVALLLRVLSRQDRERRGNQTYPRTFEIHAPRDIRFNPPMTVATTWMAIETRKPACRAARFLRMQIGDEGAPRRELLTGHY